MSQQWHVPCRPVVKQLLLLLGDRVLLPQVALHKVVMPREVHDALHQNELGSVLHIATRQELRHERPPHLVPDPGNMRRGDLTCNARPEQLLGPKLVLVVFNF